MKYYSNIRLNIPRKYREYLHEGIENSNVYFSIEEGLKNVYSYSDYADTLFYKSYQLYYSSLAYLDDRLEYYTENEINELINMFKFIDEIDENEILKELLIKKK